MAVKLGNADDTIPVCELKDGQIGVIAKWIIPSCIGRIVQRYDDKLITIGKGKGQGWSPCPKDENNRVRVLRNRETLIITNNA